MQSAVSKLPASHRLCPLDSQPAPCQQFEVVDGERRDSVLGLINGALHHATYTDRDGKVRMITLRKANKREMKRYNER